MSIFSIYKATNACNGKSYIGFARNVVARKSAHKGAALVRLEDTKFYRAIRKYGWESFAWETLFQSKDQEYLLTKAEPFFISFFDAYENGYNSTKGGEGTVGYNHTDAAKVKMSAAWTIEKRQALSTFRKGKYFSSDEGRERTRQAHLGTKRNRSLEHQQKILEVHQKYKYHTPLGVFDSVKKASQFPHDCSLQTLRNRCLGITRQIDGTEWKEQGYFVERIV